MTIRLFVQRAGEVTAEIPEFSEFGCVMRDKGVGSWTISGPNVVGLHTLVQQDGSWLRAERDGQLLMAGPIGSFEYTDDDNGEVITVSGYSEDVILADNIVYPGQMQNTPNGKVKFPDHKYLTFVGPAEAALYFYANAAVNDGNKYIGGLPPLYMGTSLDRGPTVYGKARLESALTMLIDINGQSAAQTGESFGWRVEDGTFTVHPNQDKRDTIVLSKESGSLANYRLSYTLPTTTHVLIGANGDNTDRTYWRAGNDAQALLDQRRIETFIDGSSIVPDGLEDADPAAAEEPFYLAAQAAKELNDRGGLPSISMTPIDLPNRTFGVDYDLGDIVNANGYVAILGEVAIAYDGNGERVTPTAGAPALSPFGALARPYQALNQRVSKLELRK